MTASSHETAAAEVLRHLAQAVQALDAETPRIEIGAKERLAQVEQNLGISMPSQMRLVYLDSNPVSLTIPLPAEDIDFIPLTELAVVSEELEIGVEYIPIATEGDIPYAVEIATGSVFAGSSTSHGWQWDPVAASLADFLGALAAVADAFASHQGDTLATTFEMNPQAQMELEERLTAIDEEYADRWLEWLA